MADLVARAGVDVRDVKAGMAEGVRAVRDGAAAMTNAAKGAADGLSDVGKAAKGMSRELAQENRVAMNLAREFGELSGASKEVAGAFGNIAAGFAMGGGIGAGIEVCKAALSLLKSSFGDTIAEVEKLNAQRLENIKGAVTELGAALERARDKFYELKGFDVEGMRLQQAYDKARESLEAIGSSSTALDDYADLYRGVGDAVSNVSTVVGGAIQGAAKLADLMHDERATRYAKAKEEVDKARKALEEYRATMDAVKAEEARQKSEGSLKDAAAGVDKMHALMRKERTKELSEVDQHAREVAAIEAAWAQRGQDQITQIRLKAQHDRAKLAATDTAALAAINEGEAREIERIEQAAASRRLGIQQKLQDRIQRGLDETAQHNAAIQERMTAEQVTLAQRSAQFQQSLILGISDAWGNAFGAIAAGQEGAVKAMTKALIQSAYIAVMTYAAQGAAASAAANAGIPGIGWILAMAGAGATYAMIMGLTNRIPSAAGGWDLADVPSGQPVGLVGHGREMMLPEELSDRIRNMTGDGGRSIHIHLPVSQVVSDTVSLMRAVRGDLGRILQEGFADGTLRVPKAAVV